MQMDPGGLSFVKRLGRLERLVGVDRVHEFVGRAVVRTGGLGDVHADRHVVAVAHVDRPGERGDHPADGGSAASAVPKRLIAREGCLAGAFGEEGLHGVLQVLGVEEAGGDVADALVGAPHAVFEERAHHRLGRGVRLAAGPPPEHLRRPSSAPTARRPERLVDHVPALERRRVKSAPVNDQLAGARRPGALGHALGAAHAGRQPDDALDEPEARRLARQDDRTRGPARSPPSNRGSGPRDRRQRHVLELVCDLGEVREERGALLVPCPRRRDVDAAREDLAGGAPTSARGMTPSASSSAAIRSLTIRRRTGRAAASRSRPGRRRRRARSGR